MRVKYSDIASVEPTDLSPRSPELRPTELEVAGPGTLIADENQEYLAIPAYRE